MRLVCLIPAFAAAMVLGSSTGHAYYFEGPWCAVESLGFSTMKENCSMLSFEQCRMETIAGNRGYCMPNPRWSGPEVYNKQVHRSHKRRVRRR